MVMNIKDLTEKYSTIVRCDCGRNHMLVTKHIAIEENVAVPAAEYVRETFGEDVSAALICDQNTETFARPIAEKMQGARIFRQEIDSFHADHNMVRCALESIGDEDFSVYIAIGAGTIHDITRMIAYRKDRPFISYPTAPSVDGFISNVAPVTVNGMKVTEIAVAPIAVFADKKIISGSPIRLIRSGFGDLLGKYVSLLDWKVSNILTGEYFCAELYEMLYSAVEDVKNCLLSEGITDNFTAKLLEGLLISGMCMQMAGNSRPASAAEHHIAHLLEMEILLKCGNLHGENVGVGSVIAAGTYEKIKNRIKNIKFKPKEERALDYGAVERYFGRISENIKKENTPDALMDFDGNVFVKNIDLITSELSRLPKKEDFEHLLTLIGGIKSVEELDIEEYNCAEAEVENLAVSLAPHIRARFTLMKLMRIFE